MAVCIAVAVLIVAVVTLCDCHVTLPPLPLRCGL